MEQDNPICTSFNRRTGVITSLKTERVGGGAVEVTVRTTNRNQPTRNEDDTHTNNGLSNIVRHENNMITYDYLVTETISHETGLLNDDHESPLRNGAIEQTHQTSNIIQEESTVNEDRNDGLGHVSYNGTFHFR